MKKLVFIISLLAMAPLIHAQDSWKIVLNNKLLISSHEPNETVNTKLVKSTEWKKKGWLEVSYIGYKKSETDFWHHSLQFTDELGNELLVKDITGSARIPTTTLRKLSAGKKQLKIYLIIAPPDPMMGVLHRIIHLGTLKLP